ncbi:MAG: NADPH-dependent FMN reductase [Panacagrimonas sp.]
MKPYDIAVIVGSNRRESINRRLAQALIKLAPESLACRWVRIDDLPMYNGDLEPDRPETVRRFTAEVAKADALLIVMPEHNRSLPAVLKNAIDWGSKPAEQNVWRNKPTAIAGTSPGVIGTAVGQQHLRQILGILGSVVMGGEAYLQFKPDLVDADGTVTNEGTRKFLKAHMDHFADLVGALAPR